MAQRKKQFNNKKGGQSTQRNDKSKMNKERRGINQDINNAEHAIKKDETKISKTSWPDGCNDVAWYTQNNQLLLDAGSISFFNPAGTIMATAWAQNKSTPGPMGLNFIPCFGMATNPLSPINVAARQLYADVRKANSGAVNYDPQDLITYIGAMDSAFMCITHLMRAYGVSIVASKTDWYMPDAYLSTMRIDPVDFRENLADYRMQINLLALKAQRLSVPAHFSYYKRHAWMCERIFLDAPSIKSQAYMFVPDLLYVYNSTGSTQGGTLEANWTTSFTKASDWIALLESILEPLMTDDDIAIMTGDMMKAYGQGSFMIIPTIPEDFITLPQYDEEVLTEILNARILGATATNSSGWTLTPNENGLFMQQTPLLSGLPQWLALDPLPLTLRVDNPTPGDVMVATRFMWTANASGTSQVSDATFRSVGTEVINRLTISEVYNPNGQYQLYTIGNGYLSIVAGSSLSATNAIIRNIAMLSKYDWHPMIGLLTSDSSTAPALQGFLQDWDNVTPITSSDLAKLDNAAVLSEFTFGGELANAR